MATFSLGRGKAMRLALSFCAITLGSFICSSVCSAVTISDAAADFSSTINTDTSTWSYRYEVGTTPDGNYSLLPTYGPANGTWSPVNPGAWNTGSSGLPEIGLNQTGQTVSNHTTTPGDNFSLTNGSLFLRPVTGDLVVLSWLYPFDTPRSDLVMTFTYSTLDTGGTGLSEYGEVRHADGSVGGNTHGTFSSGVNGISHLSGPLMPGDRINFILSSVGPSGSDDDTFDALKLSANVATVPEPSTLALLGLGSLGLLVRRKFAR
jgi:PEP-CTERM motif